MTEISNRILKTELIPWREAEWFQDKLKSIPKQSLARLKNSLRNNSFVQPFNVWQNGKINILDGHHRKLAMEELEKEGVVIPDHLPANFIDCKNKREAKKLVLVYSSIYARASMESLDEFIKSSDLNFDKLKLEIDLPEIVMDFVPIDFGNPPKSVSENVAELSDIRDARRRGNDNVVRKTDTERYLVIVFPTREEREHAVRNLGLPADERYVPSSSVEISQAGVVRPVRTLRGEKVKVAASKKAGSTG